MPKMPVMEPVVKILEDEGVDVVFGIPGAAILPLHKALSKSQKIRHLTARHEEGATRAADGWARVTGKVGVAIDTSGPAGANQHGHRPLHLPGGLHSHHVYYATGRPAPPAQGGLPGREHRRDRKPVTKKSYCVLKTAQSPQVFREAFKIARGAPGPGPHRPALRRAAGRWNTTRPSTRPWR